MFSIGEFARQGRAFVPMLRHYDAIEDPGPWVTEPQQPSYATGG
jgi:hypothetical protein